MVQKRSRSQKRSRQQHKSRSHSKRRSRSHKGGRVWYNPLSWFSSDAPEFSLIEKEESTLDKVGNTLKSGLDKADAAIGSASSAAAEGVQNLVEKTKETLNTDVSLTGSNEQATTPSSIIPTTTTMGGRSRARARALAKSRGRSRARYLAKTGGRGLGLTYYATPVDGVKVAQPTYFENYQGGKRRRRTMKRSRK